MTKSLQDQLLELGLASQPAAKTSRAGKPGPPQSTARKRKPKSRQSSIAAKGRDQGGSASGEDISLEQAYRIRQREEQASQDRKRARKMEEDRKRALLNKAIKEIVDGGRLNVAEATEARYFMFKNRIRKVYVTPEQLEKMNSGELGVVYLTGGYHLLKSADVAAVRALSAEHVPDLLAGEDDGPGDPPGDSQGESDGC